MVKDEIFSIASHNAFEQLALKIFRFQYTNNRVYQQYCNLLGVSKTEVSSLVDIPFLPIAFFKLKKVLSHQKIEQLFTSSGTTGSTPSNHFVSDLSIYESSFTKGFEYFYGDISDYTVLALLPSYLEREGSSLVYMADHMIKNSSAKESGFYLNEVSELIAVLKTLKKQDKKVLLLGVSFALLDLAEKIDFSLPKHFIVMETGGMKGRRKEMIRAELHSLLKKGFGTSNIHSEYGMTELLSQAYSKGNGIFTCPPWMKICIRDPEDPLQLLDVNKSGGINVIDLANINSCSFIATQDLGKIVNSNGDFEVLGRFDHSDIRGCNLMTL
ncbi:acyl transferase [Aquimarina brevivitae]|uniref:Acyl-protein synthetase LuxE n=1 Tax=Aquimarina brevivitae TaxID=323412 RepID=A0A4Q7PI55_9FLAO|nr:acyl transferase [Aquimarina brevivitae]RZS99648.1 acyl-protein synthetase LuxE [Aquimarina brevivitae]